jgi:hypothetical protein
LCSFVVNPSVFWLTALRAIVPSRDKKAGRLRPKSTCAGTSQYKSVQVNIGESNHRIFVCFSPWTHPGQTRPRKAFAAKERKNEASIDPLCDLPGAPSCLAKARRCIELTYPSAE